SFLEAVADYLVQKTMAAADSSQVRSIVVAGGVSRNRILRERFQRATEQRGLSLFFPAPDHCTDNASMVAWLGYEKYRAFPKLNYADLYLNSYSRALFRSPGRHR
ncbi:MAG TPA: tRNA (adenosine(37)-N6)-threonylcarbamoyltransferase complex transferase subunit TsaD, partial [Candidatus Aminicenantes bacterium]|nr:tRNA (adenosine(37)-N6)-threonylcarbamoyltransferase complex transferase subunit TsaD [Candidatus Aminicenantes bacterium]